MEDGKRLENLSWRLWNRETFCCNPASQARSKTSPHVPISRNPKAAAMDIPVPALSSSIDSASSSSSDDSEEGLSIPLRTSNTATIPKARPELRCADFCESRSRGREKHITPVDLEKIVISIKETKQLDQRPIELPACFSPNINANEMDSGTAASDLSNLHLDSRNATERSDAAITSRPTEQSSSEQPSCEQTSEQTSFESQSTEHSSADQFSTELTSIEEGSTERSSATTTRTPSIIHTHASMLESSTSTVNTDGKESELSVSDSSSHTEMSAHSVVRGFVPGGAPSSYRSQTNLAAAQPTPILKNAPRSSQPRLKKKGPMFTIGTSSGEEESSLESHMLRSALSASLQRPSSNLSALGSKKQTSFKEEVAVGRAAEHSPVFESDDETEEDEVSESAIEDDEDDSSDWEDSDHSAHSSLNEQGLFQRVDSRPNLTPRRSLLTTLMHEPDRARALANAASRSTPAMRRSRNSTPSGPSIATSPAEEQSPEQSVPDEPRGRPIIPTTSNIHQYSRPHSPRTTRRNMLQTELTESLRRNLLWERQHKSTGNLAALKRRHTSNDVKNLKQHPEPVALSQEPEVAKTFTNEYFHSGLGEYHSKGW